MTTQSIIESVMTVFPKVKESQVVKDLDELQKNFAEETGSITGTGSLSSISTSVGWTLPSDFAKLHGVDPLRFYDSSGNPKYLSGTGYNYGYEIQFGKLYIYSLSDTPITGLDSSIDSAYIHYEKYPTTITSRSIALEIDEGYRKGLEHGLLADYFSKYPVAVMNGGQIVEIINLNAASYHRKIYQETLLRAKRYARKKEYSGTGQAQIYQDAGAKQLVRRTKDASLGSATVTQVASLSTIYSKWVIYNITSGMSGDISPSTTAVGYSTISANISGTTLTISSTAEFGNDTQVTCNNGNVDWVQNSSSEIVVTLPGSFTLISLEVWERI